MQQIFSVTAPIYLIMAAGFVAVRWGLFTKEEARVLGRFVVNFCVPTLVFRALSHRTLGEVLNGPYLAAYALGSVLVFLGAVAWSYRLRGQPMPLAALKGLGMSGSNSAFVGYPIIMQLLGPAAGVALALTMMVENILILPLALVLAESNSSLRWHQALLRSMLGLLKNPMFVGILAGFTFALFDWELPEVLDRTAQITATAASPIALFVIGASLVGLRLDGMQRDLAGVVLGKLLLHPLAVFAALLLMPPVDPTLKVAAVMFAAMPMLSMYPALAQKYQHEGFCAAALLAATVLSFVTISLWVICINPMLTWFGHGFLPGY